MYAYDSAELTLLMSADLLSLFWGFVNMWLSLFRREIKKFKENFPALKNQLAIAGWICQLCMYIYVYCTSHGRNNFHSYEHFRHHPACFPWSSRISFLWFMRHTRAALKGCVSFDCYTHSVYLIFFFSSRILFQSFFLLKIILKVRNEYFTRKKNLFFFSRSLSFLSILSLYNTIVI